MPPLRRRRGGAPLLRAGLAAFLAAAGARASAGDALADTWPLLRAARGTEALQSLAAAPDSPETDLARAVALVHAQPLTRARIDEADTLLARVAGSEGASPLGLAARYQAGRLAELHPFAPDPARAARLFRELHALAPEELFSQMALAKALRLEASLDPSRLEALGAEGEQHLREPAALLAHHLAFASLTGEAGSHRRRLHHLQTAEQIGPVQRAHRAAVTLGIAAAAERLGETQTARQAYARFVAEHPADNRAHEAALRRDALAPAP
jgi:hypothetical protein